MTKPVLPSPDSTALAALDRAQLFQAVEARVEAAWALCREVHPQLPRPGVWFDLRGGSAGQAHLGRGGLRFNPSLLEENRDAFMVEVVPHEMAHWLVFHLQDGTRLKPHGREWQTVMRELFGLAAQVTHRFDTRRARPTPYRYRCGCQEHGFTSRRHGLVLKGRRYRCRDCAQTLVYHVYREADI
ncbi:SprT-like domain-containing protein [Halomonas sp. Bachu 37]|uniref:SprT family zinc-dependent metalloprotease n=1 Tax=Halomonas kashgarensis TaxID=3084920 RepID=UPI0032168098